MIAIDERPDHLIFSVLAVPNASRSMIVGEYDAALKIKLAAPPVAGKANRLCLKFLAKQLGVPRSTLAIKSGETGRRKQVGVYFSPDGPGRKARARVKARLAQYTPG